jgi:hypothetical protein
MKSMLLTEANVAEFIRQVFQRAHFDPSRMVAEFQRELDANVAAMREMLAEVRADRGKHVSHTDVIYELTSQLQDARNELNTTRRLLAEARAELSRRQALDAFNKWQMSATDTVN